MKTLLKKWWPNQQGQSLAEYALLLAMAGLLVLGGASLAHSIKVHSLRITVSSCSGVRAVQPDDPRHCILDQR